MEKINFDGLEEATFAIDKDAGNPKEMTCSNCHQSMEHSGMEVALEGGVSIQLTGFECHQCRKKYLGLEEAKKLDRAFIVSRVLKNDFVMERSLSFDGHNWTFRVPKEFTHQVHKKKIEIIPLGSKQFCASIE